MRPNILMGGCPTNINQGAWFSGIIPVSHDNSRDLRAVAGSIPAVSIFLHFYFLLLRSIFSSSVRYPKVRLPFLPFFTFARRLINNNAPCL